MLSNRSELVKTFGEKVAKKLESILAELSKEADAAGIEKKENLIDQFVTTVIKAVDAKQESKEMIYKELDLVAYLKEKVAPTATKAAPATSGPSMFAPRYFGVGVPPVHGGPANVTKDNAPDGTLLGNIFANNQSYGKPAAKGGTILDGLFDANQKWGRGE